MTGLSWPAAGPSAAGAPVRGTAEQAGDLASRRDGSSEPAGRQQRVALLSPQTRRQANPSKARRAGPSPPTPLPSGSPQSPATAFASIPQSTDRSERVTLPPAAFSGRLPARRAPLSTSQQEGAQPLLERPPERVLPAARRSPRRAPAANQPRVSSACCYKRNKPAA